MPPGLSIPEPSSDDLMNPVPNAPDPSSQAPSPDLMKTFQGLNPNPAPAAAPSNDLNAAFQGLSGNSPNPDDQNPSVGNLPGGIFDGEAPQNLKNQASVTAQNIRDFGVNFLSNLKSNPEGSLQVWKDAVGDDNAKISRGKIYFRWDKKDEFRPVSKGMFDGMANFISQHSKAATFGAVALAAGPIAGAAADVLAPAVPLAEGAGLAARIASGLSANSMTSAGLAGAAGGAAAPALSDASQNLMGSNAAPGLAESAGDVGAGAIEGAAGNMAGQAAVGTVAPIAGDAVSSLGSGISSVAGKIRNLLPESAEALWGKAEGLYGNLKQVFKNSGMQLPESQYSLGTTLVGEETPKGIVKPGVFQQIRKDLSDRIGVFVKDADLAAGNKKFSIQGELDELQKNMEAAGIRFEESTKPDFSDASMKSGDVKDVTTKYAIAPSKASAEDNPYAFGEKNSSNIDWMVQYYNRLAARQAGGGVKPSEITDFEQAIGDKAFDKDSFPSSRLQALMKKTSYSLSNRQRDILKEAISGDQEYGPYLSQSIDSAYSEYSQKIDPLRQFVKQFHGTGAASQFADQLIQPTNVEEVRSLHHLLADEYPEVWGQVKGNWLSNAISKNSDQNILNAKSLSDTLFGGNGSRGYDKEVLDLMFEPAEQMNLKTSLRALAKIPNKTFTKTADQEDLVRHATQSLFSFGRVYHQVKATKALFGLMKENGPIADYMAGEGFLRMAEEAADPVDKVNLIQLSDSLKKDLAGSQKVYAPKIGYRYGSPVVASPIYEKEKETLGSLYGK